jgi:ketosteroid isomerase-like protein
MEMMREPAGPGDLVERLCRVTNEHDLQAVGACFATDYRLEMPTHPGRDFVGREQVLRNWGQIFAGVPDIAVDTRWVTHGDTAWSEWEMRGTRRDGSPHLMRGVIIFRVRDGEFSSARFYVEPVEQGSVGVEEMIRQTVQVGTAPMASGPAAAAPSAGSEGAGR